MRLKINKLTKEQYTDIMFCSVFGFSIVMFTFNNLIRFLVGNTFYLDSIFIYVCYIMLLIHALPRVLGAMKPSYWFFIMIMLALPLLMCRNTDVTSKILSQMFPYAILSFMYGVAVKDYKQLWEYMYKFSWMVVVMAFVDTFVIETMEGTSHMLGYVALFPACVLFIEFLNNKRNRIINIVGILISMVLVIQADTAGALAAVALCAIVGIFYMMKKFKKIVFIIIVVLLGVIALVLNKLSSLIIFFINILGNFNVNVSVLEEILYTGITTDRFRDSIYDYCLTYAKSHLFYGSGVGNDRVLITQNTLVNDQTMTGNYPHNIFLEFMIQFGLIFGIVISVFLVVYLICYLILEKDQDVQKIATVLMGIGFFPLLYSSSYLENSAFYLLIGFSWCRLHKIKQSKSAKNLRTYNTRISSNEVKV